MRVHFNELFTVKNGVVEPKVPIHISDISMGPGVSFTGGVSFGGVDFTKYIGKYFDVNRTSDGGYEIIGVYE